MGRVIMSGVVPLLTAPVRPVTWLTFSSPSAFSISVASPGWNGAMEYSTDTYTWNTWTGAEISGASKDGEYVLYIRGTGNTKATGSFSKKWTLTGTNIACNGNIEFLLDYTTVASGSHPTMASGCYQGMFYNCTALITAPALPATILTASCYYDMFSGCTGLTAAPALPATTLASSCYSHMFSGCTGLTTAPALPATTLADECYRSMFECCTSLISAPALPAAILASACYIRMFYGCTGLTSAPVLPATMLANSCYGNMFVGCTSLVAIPVLPATALVDSCYSVMFQNCTKLKLSATRTGSYTNAYRIPASGTGTTANYALYNMFAGTGGTFTGTPKINTTYYLDESNSIIS